MELFSKRFQIINSRVFIPVSSSRVSDTHQFYLAIPAGQIGIPIKPFHQRLGSANCEVHPVGRFCGFPKIRESIVEFITIDVVKEGLWKASKGHIPNQPVNKESGSFYSDGQIAIRCFAPHNDVVAYALSIPPQESGFRGIIESSKTFSIRYFIPFHNSKIKGQQREVETATDLSGGSKHPQIFGMNSTSRHALCS